MTKENNKKTIGALFRQGYALHYQGKPGAKNAMCHIDAMWWFWGEGTLPSEITVAEITRFKIDQQARGLTPGSIDRKLSTLSVLLKHCEDMGELASVPKIKKFNDEAYRDRFLSQEESQAIYDKLHGDFITLFKFLLQTGCRIREALGLTWADLKLAVEASSVTFWNTKIKKGTMRNRTVPLAEPVAGPLRQYQEYEPDSAGPFTHIPYARFHKALQDAAKAAGIEDYREITPHTLRHTCASWLVAQGVDLYRIKHLLGHQRITTTERYAHLAPNALTDILPVMNRLTLGTPDGQTLHGTGGSYLSAQQ